MCGEEEEQVFLLVRSQLVAILVLLFEVLCIMVHTAALLWWGGPDPRVLADSSANAPPARLRTVYILYHHDTAYY